MSKTLAPVRTTEAVTPLGHYEQGVRFGDTVYVSAQLGVAKDTPDPASVPIGDQVRRVLSSIEAIARAAGTDRTGIARVTIYIADIAGWDEANKAYADFFGVHKPARSVVPCGTLHLGAKVGMDAVICGAG